MAFPRSSQSDLLVKRNALLQDEVYSLHQRIVTLENKLTESNKTNIMLQKRLEETEKILNNYLVDVE